MTAFYPRQRPACPIERAAPDMFRILQNLIESHPEGAPPLNHQAGHDLREARALIERTKDQLLQQPNPFDQPVQREHHAH